MIMINQVYQNVDDENRRIRIIELEEDHLYWVDIDAISSMPKKELLKNIETEKEQHRMLLISDPYARGVMEEDLTDIQIKKRNKDWEIIESHFFPNKEGLLKKQGRERIIKKIASECGISQYKVKQVLSRFWQRGMHKNALIPDYDKSGGKGKEKRLTDAKVGRPRNVTFQGDSQVGVNITKDIRSQFEFVINKYYRTSKQYSLREVYNALLKKFYSDKYKEDGVLKYKLWDQTRVPTYHQFYYWFKKVEDPKKDIQFRKGTKEFELKNRPILSNSKQETNGPGTRFQVDATIADVYVVSSFDRNRVIGRPVIYAVIDVYSRLITGVYVGLEGPSWIGAMMALDNMVSNKVDFCKQYDITITENQWPAYHVPEIIIADRGEFEGYSVGNLINNINIKIENTSAYRGDLKGIVERKFRTINGKIKQKTPGAIQKEFRERGDIDYRLHATLNLKEFTHIFIQMVLHHNFKIVDKYPMEKEMIAANLTPSPINLWNWGIANKKGRLRTVDKGVFRLNVLPQGKATVSRAGIKFKNLLYGSKKALEEQWYLKLRNQSINIVYDPRNMNRIYIPHDDGKGFDSCTLLEPSQQHKDDFLEEIIFQQQLFKELTDMEKNSQSQLAINLDEVINSVIKKAKSEKDKVKYNGQSNAQKLKGIQNNKAFEKEINRESEQFDLAEEDNTKPADVINVHEHLHEKNAQSNSYESRILEKLRKKRDEDFERE
ncbi:Mu transposase C-terminal domain-containing protein [Virgibacillus dokdonensis]|uniref:Mu transposase C-terminal domain-containing protein n=1 Tax=Virgibacillus dokdonensis TaxID=302167 RepID=UPI00098BA4CC|nr:Mu transposase C-terminal domain-containing protein [Virgibacillus dokdonensis]